MHFFEAVTSSKQLLFQKMNFFRSRYFLQMSLFLIVPRNQFHSIYTFTHSMVVSGLEIPQPSIAENSKQRINFNSVTNVSFWEPGNNFGICKKASKNSRNTFCSKDVAMRTCLK